MGEDPNPFASDVREGRSRRLLSRAYRLPARPFSVLTEDGVRLRGHRIGGAEEAVVFVHGFLGWHRKPRLVAFQEALARRFAVYAFDLRGHGASEGRSALGTKEHLDVDAVVRLARADGHRRVVTVGGSMGGVAVVGQAAGCGGVDGVVAVSTPARWFGHDSTAVRRLIWLTASRSGHRLLRSVGIRLVPRWERGEEPAELVGGVAPTPILIVHGRDDHFFEEEEAWLLYRRANPPKRLWLASRFGHAEDGYTASFAERLVDAIPQLLSAREPEAAVVAG